VLLITIDTLRTDALGSYGNAQAATPWMDRLAAAGVRFTDAHAHNVLTLPSHANILSGLYPQEHGLRDNSGFRFAAEPPTLASVLREHGYRTGAFVSAFPLDSRFGLDHGFETYEDSFVDTTSRPAFLEQERAGAETVSLAVEWLAAADERPSFGWVHLYDRTFPTPRRSRWQPGSATIRTPATWRPPTPRSPPCCGRSSTPRSGATPW
jgi:arylsulfatase A-like enzyme